jgi:hypothetical protein
MPNEHKRKKGTVLGQNPESKNYMQVSLTGKKDIFDSKT